MTDLSPEELARMAWREQLDGDDTSGTEQPAQTAWYALSREDRAGLLAEQEHAHTRDWLKQLRSPPET